MTTEDQFEKFNNLGTKLMTQDTFKINLKYHSSLAQSNLDWISKNLDEVEEALNLPLTSELSSTTDLSEVTTAGVGLSTTSPVILLFLLIIMSFTK